MNHRPIMTDNDYPIHASITADRIEGKPVIFEFTPTDPLDDFPSLFPLVDESAYCRVESPFEVGLVIVDQPRLDANQFQRFDER